MKKLEKLLLATMILCVFVTGCSSNTVETKPVSTQRQEQTDAVVEKEETTQPEKEPEITIEESMIYESDMVTVTVKGIEESWSGLEIKLLVENKTDRNIALSGMDMVVNGVTLSGGLYIDVAAGKKANGTISLYSNSLEMAGIEAIATLRTCDAHIVDTDSYETLAQVDLEIVTSLGESYIQELDESGEMLYESNGVSVIAKFMEDEFYGKSLRLFVKNESGKDVTIQAENVSVNGFTVDGWMYDLVCAGTVRFCELDLWESGLEENDISEIEEISFTISLIDPNSYNTIAKSDELQVFVTE